MLKRVDKVAEQLVGESLRDYLGNAVAIPVGAASQVKINPQHVVIFLRVLVIHCIVHLNGASLSDHKMQNGNCYMLCTPALCL